MPSWPAIPQTDPPKAINSPDKPALPKRLFWEFVYETIDWQKAYSTVIERVIDRGNPAEWEELLRFYGRDKVVQVLKFESTYLMDHTIEKVCVSFNMRPEELRCYMRKQSRVGHWL